MQRNFFVSVCLPSTKQRTVKRVVNATEIIVLISQTLWYFLPAFVANMTPVFATYFNWLPALNYPLDGGMKLGREPFLGANKTIRGLVVGLIFGSITALIQYWLQPIAVLQPLHVLPPPTALHALGWGALLGFGALFGDALKSFFKRRLHITAGASWPPWDQIDIVIGVVVVTWWIAPLPTPHVITAFIIIGCGMFITSYAGKIMRIKNTI